MDQVQIFIFLMGSDLRNMFWENLQIVFFLFSDETKLMVLCLSGQEMAPTGQKSLLKDSWCQNSILWKEQLADPPIA